MRTLADMTEEERAQCVGMWCDYTRDGEEKDLVIVAAGTNDAGRIPCVNPGAPIPSAWAPEPWTLTPRPDLPRAWAPDSQPTLTKYWTIEQAADYTQLSTRTIRRRIADGSLTAYRHGRTIRLKPQDIDTLFTRVEPREMDEA